MQGDWPQERGRIEERFARFDDRIGHIEKALDKIKDNSTWLMRLAVGAFLTLLGHVLLSFIQMGGLE